MNGSGSHHFWGNLGYWLSARLCFFNHIGWIPIVHNPDSWAGWYWGAMHPRAPESCGTVEDCLKECDMVVFWSSAQGPSSKGMEAHHQGEPLAGEGMCHPDQWKKYLVPWRVRDPGP